MNEIKYVNMNEYVEKRDALAQTYQDQLGGKNCISLAPLTNTVIARDMQRWEFER